MTKTPDKIKKGLECCIKSCYRCEDDCPYRDVCKKEMAFMALQEDSLTLIQQLQVENAEQAERIRVLESRNNALYHTILGVMHFVDKWLDCPAYDPDEDLKGTAAVARAAHAREIALQAIEQLEAENEKLHKANAELCRTSGRLERERDALAADFKLYRERNIKGECGVYACDLCKRGGKYEEWEDFKCPEGCMGLEHWEWRGVQKEE